VAHPGIGDLARRPVSP